MSKSSPETTNRLDGLILGCLLAAPILILSILSNASLLPTLMVLAASLISLLLYLRITNHAGAHQTEKTYDHEQQAVDLENLKRLIDTFPRATAMIDDKGDVVHANPIATALLSPDMINRPASAYLRNSELRERINQAFSGIEAPSLTIDFFAPTERILNVDFSAPFVLKMGQDDRVFIFAVISDRTEASLAREKQADFLANASHELKTPIASLKGYIETLRGHAKDDPDAQDMFLGIMQDQTDRMERLVTDLLSLRKIESSEHIAPSETADLCEALEAVRDVLRPLAEERDVSLSVDLKSLCPAIIFGKTDECIQLFLNLIENAIKLSSPGETVRVEMDYLEKWNGEIFSAPSPKGSATRRIVNLAPNPAPAWRVVISDSGPGVSRDHLPRIGERFYRVAGDLPAQEKGTGLGLAIVKHVAMRHRAGLFVQSVHPSHYADTAKLDSEPTGTSFSVVFIDRGSNGQEPEVVQ